MSQLRIMGGDIYHHQLNITSDRQRILAISYKFPNNKSERRLDKIEVISLEGKVLHELTSDKLFAYNKKAVPNSSLEWTHVNSIYEIPIIKGNAHSAFRPGHFIINSLKQGICGSVQKLDSDHFLISHVLMGTYVYSISKKKMISYTIFTNFRDNTFYPVFSVKAYDLEKFLSFWK